MTALDPSLAVPRIACPCRGEAELVHRKDFYRSDPKQGYMVCSYCGSVHPDQFMVWLHEHQDLIPTNRNYKVYVDHPKFGYVKFYFQHLSAHQQEDFTTLWRSGHFRLASPGKFYVLPFFIKSEDQ